MGSYTYGTKIGDYNDKVRLDIELQIKDIGVTKEEYEQLKISFALIEEIALKYRYIVDVESEEAEPEREQ